MARILVIDDDEPLAALLRTVLEAAGHIVTTLGTGREALALMARQVFDLLITDLIVPDQDGLEVIMVARRTMVRLPILAISGNPANGDLYLTIARKLGADAVLAKPFTPEQLLAAIRQLLAPHSNAS